MPTNYKKILLIGVVAAIISIILGFVTCGWIFNFIYTLPPVEVWKIFTPTTFAIIIVYSLIYYTFITLIFAKVRKVLPIDNVRAGLFYGTALWIVTSLNGAVPTFLFMNVNQIVPIYWALIGLLDSLIIATVIAMLYKEK